MCLFILQFMFDINLKILMKFVKLVVDLQSKTDGDNQIRISLILLQNNRRLSQIILIF